MVFASSCVEYCLVASQSDSSMVYFWPGDNALRKILLQHLPSFADYEFFCVCLTTLNNIQFCPQHSLLTVILEPLQLNLL